MASRSRCAGITKKGTRCRNQPVEGESQCIAHLPRKAKESLGFGGSQPGSGRPRNLTRAEALRERVEAEVDAVLDPLFAGLEAVLSDGSPNHAMRIRSAEALWDRAYGRPRQAVELAGESRGEGGTWHLENLNDDELRRLQELAEKAEAR